MKSVLGDPDAARWLGAPLPHLSSNLDLRAGTVLDVLVALLLGV